MISKVITKIRLRKNGSWGTAIIISIMVLISGSCNEREFHVEPQPEEFKYVPPSDVGKLNWIFGDQQVTITWVDPPESNIANIVIANLNDETETTVKTGIQTVLLSGLRNNEKYRFRIKAINDIGLKSLGAEVSGFPFSKEMIGVPPEIVLNPSEVESINFNSTVSVNGTTTSKVGLKSISYVLVRKSPYLELQTVQNISLIPGINEKEFSFEVTVDNENADAIRVESKDIYDYSSISYVNIKSIGGRAYVFYNVEMAPEWEIPFTAGVIPTQPYLFSIDGIQVGNELKNVVTLKEALDASAGSIDFAFVNLWRNSSFGVIANRGFAYISAARLSGGPVGRQVDTDWLSGITKNSVGFNVITSDIVASMELDHFFETTTGNWQIFDAEVLSALDSYVPASLVSNDANRILKQRTNAGTSGTCNLEITSGTYIAFRRVVDGSEDKFGIIKVIEAAHDTDATSDGCKIADTITGSATVGASTYYTGTDLPGFVYEGVTKLYGRSCKLKIIVQQ